MIEISEWHRHTSGEVIRRPWFVGQVWALLRRAQARGRLIDAVSQLRLRNRAQLVCPVLDNRLGFGQMPMSHWGRDWWHKRLLMGFWWLWICVCWTSQQYRNLMMERWQRWDRRAVVGILPTDQLLWWWNYPMTLFYLVPLKRCVQAHHWSSMGFVILHRFSHHRSETIDCSIRCNCVERQSIWSSHNSTVIWAIHFCLL